MKRRLLIAVAVAALFGAPATAAASPAIRLTIAHTLRNCHVWQAGKTVFGATRKVQIVRGGSIVIRSSCPMDFDARQLAGPPLDLADPRLPRGNSRTLTFTKRGTYVLQFTNVQTPEEANLQVLGEANTLTLVVVVR